jgi:hypothetical protein
MTAFVEDATRPPAAFSYIRNTTIGGDTPYVYVTRRTYDRPADIVTLYNLGCNGVGFLPSIYGGHRIARLLAGKWVPPSVFDPR